MFQSSRPPSSPSGRRHPLALAAIASMAASAAAMLVIAQPANAGIVPTVPLASAADYSVIGATTVTNTNPSVLGQSVGLSPGTAVVGFPPGLVLAPGTIQAANAVSLQAQQDVTIAYVDAAGRSVEFTEPNPDLAGRTLIPGVYAASAKAPLGLSGQLVLDGQGNPNAVFIFQTDSTLITSTGSTIALINGASECNVFWQVGSSATIGSGSLFVGTVLALTSITVESSAVVHGRMLARNGAVTLDNNVFTQPSCAPTTDLVPTATAPATTTTTTAATATTLPPPGDSSGATTVPGDASGATTVPTGPGGTGSPTTLVTPTTFPFGFTDLTLPRTGVSRATTTSGVGTIALVTGFAALLIARRRPAV